MARITGWTCSTRPKTARIGSAQRGSSGCAPTNSPARLPAGSSPRDPDAWRERTLGAMPIYVVLSNFTETGRTDVKNTSERLERLAPVGEKLGVKILANAITMGQYDVVTVMEAPDDATIAKVISKAGHRLDSVTRAGQSREDGALPQERVVHLSTGKRPQS